ncbi:MAG: hypothetical protein ACRENA_15275 [Vulcanimicrobiaceae bacterium]
MKRLPARVFLVLALVVAAGCAKPASQQSAGGSETQGTGRVGYVRMQQLVKAHPLYGQLHQIELSIDALNLRSLGPEVAQTGADLSKQDAELQKELNEASARTKKILAEKQFEYQREENAAIDAALAASGRASSGHPLASGVGATAQQQASGVSAQMNRNLQAYAKTLDAQQRDQIQAYQKAVAQRLDRQYQAKANELQSKESEFALSLATKDAAQRLDLRTRLSNLALDNAARQNVKGQLDALDRSESDQVAAMRNRDQQTLVQLRTQLRAQGQREMDAGVAKIRAQAQSKMTAAGRGAAGPAPAPGASVAAVNLPPDLKARIDALHKQYQDRFSQDAKATIDQFKKTRDELQQRYNELHGVDAASSVSLQKELASLQSEHDKLYQQIVDQINREVRVVAQERGVTTVLSEVAGDGQGVDLTEPAKKEIESLHE